MNFSGINYGNSKLTKAMNLYDETYWCPTLTLRFMTGMIGLESLLVRGRGELIYQLSRNCAVLLCGNDASKYESIKKEIKALYDLRSRFVHEGVVTGLEQKHIVLVRKYLRDTINEIIKLNKTRDELLEYLDHKGIE